ncbi:MAG: carbon monoxide dehydrogenase [Xanthobacteraceae bacterium]|jgi:carbon-monoxide dehydrogenase medium subunit|nr:carbon monoxide dehydrogenase [Xanthobacteraceae bacterium]
MFSFNYHRPESLEAALALAAEGEDAKLLAGGQTLIPTLKQRLASPSDLIDLAVITGLQDIVREGDVLRIGAMARHAAVAASPIVREAIPALAELAGLIGDPALRHRGTLGGSIANNDPSADYPAALLGLDAIVETDRRRIAAGDFFLGLFETALEPGEIVTSVTFPIGAHAAYQKLPNPASRYAMAGVFVARGEGGVSVAVTGASQSGVFRWSAAEAALEVEFSAEALAGLSLPADEMIADIHGSGAYRAHLAGVMARRAVTRLASGN